MQDKYLVTIDLTSLHALKNFIRLVKEAGASISVSGEGPDNSSRLDNPVLVPILEAENIFGSEIKIYAASLLDLEKANEALNCVIGEKAEKSATSSLLESIMNFTGMRQTSEVGSN